jgi:hypothetical protein
MATGEPIYLDAVNDRGVGVRVAFTRIGDLFSQTLYGIRGSQVVEVACSVDREDFDGWPLSPPVQELREVPDDSGRPTLVMLGSAAYGHWSATVRTAYFDQANPYLEFDTAVRLHRRPAYIGIAYDAMAGTTWTGTHGGVAFAQRDPHALVISAPLESAESCAPTDLLKGFEAPGMPTRRLFFPATPLPMRYPATFRWQYCVASALA